MYEAFRARVLVEITKVTQWPNISRVEAAMNTVAAQMENEEALNTPVLVQEALAPSPVGEPDTDEATVLDSDETQKTVKTAEELQAQADADHEQQATAAVESQNDTSGELNADPVPDEPVAETH